MKIDCIFTGEEQKEQLRNEITDLRRTVGQEKFEKEASKSKMLNLEMADYERSIKSLNVQLINKEKEVVQKISVLSQLKLKLQFQSQGAAVDLHTIYIG